MDQLPVTFERRENYLLVTGFGERKDLITLVEGSEKINEVITGVQSHFLLLDYTQARFNVPLGNAFDLIRIYELKMPEIKTLVVSVALHHDDYKIGEYWKDIAQKRGFHFMVSYSFEDAETWLLAQKRKIQ